MRHRSMIPLLLLASAPLGAQGARPDPAKLMAAQAEAMLPLQAMDGVWRGTAWTLLPSGEKHTVTQTERVGPFLGGTVKVVEGRGYEADGRVTFNAFGTISYSPATQAYRFHSYAMGQSGDFMFKPTPTGFIWEIPAGPMTLRYTATLKDGTWTEVGDRLVPGQEPARFFEMTLKRVGATDWPAGGAVPKS